MKQVLHFIKRWLMVLALSGLFLSAAQAQTLRMSSWVPSNHYINTEIMQPWAEAVANATEGRVKVKILPKAVGTPQQHWELVRQGVADVAWGNFTYEPERFAVMWFPEFPFVGTDAKAQSITLWEVYNTHLKGNSLFRGVEILSLGMPGGGMLHHHSKPLASLADLSGQKIRIGGPTQKLMIEEMGAVPVAASATKMYEMLESNVVDGTVGFAESIPGFSLEEQLPYHTTFPDGLYSVGFFLAMNERIWKRLSEEDQAAIASVSGAQFAANFGEVFNQKNEAAMQAMEALGHTFSEADADLVEKVDEVRANMIADWEAAARKAGIDDPQAILDDYAAAYAKHSETEANSAAE